MRRLSGLLAALVLSLPALHGADAQTPSRIVLTWSGDPATTQSVTWHTDAMTPSPQAQVAGLTADPGFEKTAATVKASAVTDDLLNGKTAAHYRADFQGLEAGARYCYRVGDGLTWSEWNVFRTASSRPETFRFLYFGDARNSIK